MTFSSSVILALECSAGQATVALSRDGDVIVQKAYVAAHGHAAWIVPLAQDALKEASLSFDQLTHIVAGRGPGSFTGIRVALAAAKGLALSLNIGATGISSLAGMAAQMRSHKDGKDRYLISSIDSRRGSMFFQAFSSDGEPMTDICDGDIDQVRALIAEKDSAWAVSGLAAHHVYDLDGDIVTIDSDAPEAKGLLSCFKYIMNEKHLEGTSITDLEPLYLSAPILGPRS